MACYLLSMDVVIIRIIITILKILLVHSKVAGTSFNQIIYPIHVVEAEGEEGRKTIYVLHEQVKCPQFLSKYHQGTILTD